MAMILISSSKSWYNNFVEFSMVVYSIQHLSISEYTLRFLGWENAHLSKSACYGIGNFIRNFISFSMITWSCLKLQACSLSH